MKKNFSRVLLAVLLTNLLGYTLIYFDLGTYIILLGFRFHLSFILPLLLLFPKSLKQTAKENFLKPLYRRKFLPLFWVILSSGIVVLILFVLNKIKIGDPEYFYEFGLSSIFDYPVYLLWNLPQMLLMFLFLSVSVQSFKNKFFPVILLILFLFAYEFIPTDLEKIDYILYSDFFLTAVSVGLFFQYFSNIYWFAIIFFSAFWINLLAFGCKSQILINLLFASQYSEWDGFFIVAKELSLYLLSAQLFLLIVFMLLSIPLAKK